VNCTAMLDQMLDADLHVLDGNGDSELARHLRHCVRCRSVASQLTHDTRWLAQAVASTRTTINSGALRQRRTPRYRRRVVVAAGIAAVLSLIVLREQDRKSVPDDSSRRVAVSPIVTRQPIQPVERPAPAAATRSVNRTAVRPSRPAPATHSASADDVRRASAIAAVPAPMAQRTVVKPVGLPVAVAPVRLDTPTETSLGTSVAVDPPAGTRANIIRTSNPTITVVWLYQ
jgi:hypothetical protein